MTLTLALVAAATSVGAVHTLAPDHYELATIGTMVVLVLPARVVAGVVRGAWAGRYGDALAGGVVAGVGLAVLALRI